MISTEIKELFKKLTPMEQRICLQELEDEYDITINFDLVTALKQRIKALEVKSGKLQSYIDELEELKKQDKTKTKEKITLAEMYVSIPEAERQEIKQKLAAGYLYRNLAIYAKQAKRELREVKTKNESLKLKVFQLSVQLARLTAENNSNQKENN